MQQHKTFFTIAALFNWIVALSFIAAPSLSNSLLLQQPSSSNAFMYLFALLVAVFGLGYFWISRNFQTNIPIVKLGIIGKHGVFGVAIILLALGIATPLFVGVAFIDFIFALLFMRSLRQNR